MSELEYLKTLKKSLFQWLSRREYSKDEIRRKLEAKNVPADIIDSLLQEFSQKTWQSDDRFTEMFVQSRIKKGQGPLRIQQELQQRGIDEELIEKHISSNLRAWLELARLVREKKFGKTFPKTFPEKVKQMNFLRYRGFDSDQIHALFKGVDTDYENE